MFNNFSIVDVSSMFCRVEAMDFPRDRRIDMYAVVLISRLAIVNFNSEGRLREFVSSTLSRWKSIAKQHYISKITDARISEGRHELKSDMYRFHLTMSLCWDENETIQSN